jgi:hypothetical protein
VSTASVTVTRPADVIGGESHLTVDADSTAAGVLSMTLCAVLSQRQLSLAVDCDRKAVKSEPVRVTVVPPLCGPATGDSESIVTIDSLRSATCSCSNC